MTGGKASRVKGGGLGVSHDNDSNDAFFVWNRPR